MQAQNLCEDWILDRNGRFLFIQTNHKSGVFVRWSQSKSFHKEVRTIKTVCFRDAIAVHENLLRVNFWPLSQLFQAELLRLKSSENSICWNSRNSSIQFNPLPSLLFDVANVADVIVVDSVAAVNVVAVVATTVAAAVVVVVANVAAVNVVAVVATAVAAAVVVVVANVADVNVVAVKATAAAAAVVVVVVDDVDDNYLVVFIAFVIVVAIVATVADIVTAVNIAADKLFVFEWNLQAATFLAA